MLEPAGEINKSAVITGDMNIPFQIDKSGREECNKDIVHLNSAASELNLLDV